MVWLTTSPFGKILILAFVLVIAHFFIKRYLAALVHRSVKAHRHGSEVAEQKREETIVNILGKALFILLWIIGILGAFAIMDINIAGLLTGAGLVGVIVGLGGQSAIKDLIAGIFILVENQYRVGDVVTLGTVSGMVEKIDLRITKIRDLDGNLHIIPNGAVNIVTNKTFGWSNVHMNIGVSYASDIEKVKEVVNKTGEEMAHDERWSGSIIEPVIFLRVDEFRESSVSIKALGKVVPGTQWDVAGEFRSRLKVAFEKNGIEIPFPQRVIHTSKK